MLSHQNSSGGSSLSVAEGYKSRNESDPHGGVGGMAKVSGSAPHRTSSFHGFHKSEKQRFSVCLFFVVARPA